MKLLEFGAVQIQQAIDNAEHIFSISDVLKHVDIWQRKHAVSVLKILASDNMVCNVKCQPEE